MAQHEAIELLHHYGRRYPGAWDAYAIMQQLHAASQPYEVTSLLGQPADTYQWSSWCWCPTSVAGEIVRRSRKTEVITDPEDTPSFLAAVAAWRATQGIYRFDEDLLRELLATSVTGKIPVDVLKRLPEWCVWVDVPRGALKIFGEADITGFFAYLDCLSGEGKEHAELNIIASIEAASLVLLPLELTEGCTVEQAIGGLIDHLERTVGREDWSGKDRAGLTQLAGKLLSVILYLCADDTDVPRKIKAPPRVVKTKKGKMIIPAAKPVVHQVGVRMGPQLRWAREYYEKNQASMPTGRSVTPHIRAAHWHTFLSGPRDSKRVPRVKWLPPIRVKIEDVPEMATLREVK